MACPAAREVYERATWFWKRERVYHPPHLFILYYPHSVSPSRPSTHSTLSTLSPRILSPSLEIQTCFWYRPPTTTSSSTRPPQSKPSHDAILYPPHLPPLPGDLRPSRPISHQRRCRPIRAIRRHRRGGRQANFLLLSSRVQQGSHQMLSVWRLGSAFQM